MNEPAGLVAHPGAAGTPSEAARARTLGESPVDAGRIAGRIPRPDPFSPPFPDATPPPPRPWRSCRAVSAIPRPNMNGLAGLVAGPGAAETLSEATTARTPGTRLVALTGAAGAPPNRSSLAAAPGAGTADFPAEAVALLLRRPGHSTPEPRGAAQRPAASRSSAPPGHRPKPRWRTREGKPRAVFAGLPKGSPGGSPADSVSEPGPSNPAAGAVATLRLRRFGHPAPQRRGTVLLPAPSPSAAPRGRGSKPR